MAMEPSVVTAAQGASKMAAGAGDSLATAVVLRATAGAVAVVVRAAMAAPLTGVGPRAVLAAVGAERYLLAAQRTGARVAQVVTCAAEMAAILAPVEMMGTAVRVPAAAAAVPVTVTALKTV